MPKWVVKVNRSGEQRRITLPKGLLEEQGWMKARVLVLCSRGDMVVMEEVRVGDGETGGDVTGDSSRAD
jgi:bifunctional DNA-binding transcriptional regulator/antitoxin component of YhaV-PrlF toxin-antitoxin module